MRVSNNEVFTDLIGSTAPSVAYTVYDPVTNWNRVELVALKRGSLLLQITNSGAGCFAPETVVIWYKRSEANSARDWAMLSGLPAIGNGAPTDSNPQLCALPVGSVYVDSDGVVCARQIYLKVRNECDGGTCKDWQPLLLTVTRTGDTFSYNADTNTMNLPVGGRLHDAGNGEYQWIRDNGLAGYSLYIPTLVDNGNGTYTYNARNGNPPITINTAANLVIPPDVSTARRPWVQVGNSQATNASSVTEAVAIFHTGGMIRGAAAFGTTGPVGAELMGNNALGGGNHVMTGAENSTIAGGSSSEIKNCKNAFVGGGVDNVIDGSGDTTYDVNQVIGGGALNDNAGHSAFIGAGDDNNINRNGIVAVIGGGSKNTANGNGAQVLGGYFNNANSFWGVALGNKSKVSHVSAFLINTHLGSNAATDSDGFASAADGEFAVRCNSIRLFTNLGQTAGVTMAAGASAWVAVSDARAKNNIQPLTVAVLPGYEKLQVVSYFMGEPVGAGITAQNYYEAFDFLEPKQVGDLFGVSQAERDGVQDKAIQELLHLVEYLNDRVGVLEAKLAQYEGE